MELLAEARSQLQTEMEKIKPWAQRRPSPCHVQCLCSFLLFWWLPATVECSREKGGEGNQESSIRSIQVLEAALRNNIEKGSQALTMVVGAFPGGLAGKEPAYNAGTLGSIPGLGRSPGEEKGYPLQYLGLESSKDCIVHGVTNSWTQLSDFHFTWRRQV